MNYTKVDQLLLKLKMDGYVKLFQEQEIDLPTLLMLESSDLDEIGVKAFGARKKILLAIAELKRCETQTRASWQAYTTSRSRGALPRAPPLGRSTSRAPTARHWVSHRQERC